MKKNVCLKLIFMYFLVTATTLSTATAAFAGGIALGTTRVIYPLGNSQVSLGITNSDKHNVFLIQSWVAGEDGSKSSDFIVTPPLFVIQPGKENTLRIMYVGKAPLPSDRETVFFLNSKAIPSAKPSAPGQNTLQIAAQTVIKLFVRPLNLPTKSNDAPKTITCHINGENLKINNPSPYYVSLVNFKIGSQKLRNTMVPPKSYSEVKVPAGSNINSIEFQTVNDFGANSSTQNCSA